MGNENDDKPFNIKVAGEGLSIEQAVDQDTARVVINLLMGGSSGKGAVDNIRHRGEAHTHDTIAGDAEGRRRVSLREFLDDCEARRNPDKITAIGEFLHSIEGLDSFSRDDIRSRFRQAGEAVPGNYPRDFAWAIRNGWISEDPDEEGEYFVTQKGRTAMDANFSAEVRRTSAQPTVRRRTRRRPSSEPDGDGTNE